MFILQTIQFGEQGGIELKDAYYIQQQVEEILNIWRPSSLTDDVIPDTSRPWLESSQ